jgi:hypothetical protein
MVAIRPKKTFLDMAGHSLLCIDPTELAVTENRSVVGSFART